MTTFIKIPFASSGDKTNPPDTDAAGGVNWTQGYPIAYSKDPATDPSAKRIEREYMNGLFNRLSTAINEIQTSGIAPFITSADNGGSPFVYSKGALVSLGGVNYISSADNNTTTPPNAAWFALPGQIQPLDATLTALAGLVNGANQIPYFSGVDQMAATDLTAFARTLLGRSDAEGVLSDLGLKTAAQRDVGTGANQIPDMSSFGISKSVNGWCKLPNGLIIQWGLAGPLTPSLPDNSINFNITFPNACLFITEHDRGTSPIMSMIQLGYITTTGFAAYNLGQLNRNIPSGLQPVASSYVQWIAIGY